MPMREKSPKSHSLDYILSMPYERLSFVWILSTLSFACIYFFLSYIPGQGPSGGFSSEPLFRFLDLLYFSVITGTSTGFGDIVPHGLSRMFSALQAISSVVIIALFVAKFVSRKQEIALENIHELSFDSAFHSIRQGMFIARKDLDSVMRKAALKEELNHKDWRNFYISVHQVQIYLRQIPPLYKVKHRSLELDVDRERLLLDAVERTLRRVGESLDLFEVENISYVDQKGSFKELLELSFLVNEIFAPQKERTTDAENKEAFQEVLDRAKEIELHTAHAREKRG